MEIVLVKEKETPGVESTKHSLPGTASEVPQFLMGQPDKHLFTFGVVSYLRRPRIEIMSALFPFYGNAHHLQYVHLFSPSNSLP